MIKYQYNNIDYNTFDEIRHMFPNVSFPVMLKQEDLTPFEISIIQEEDIDYSPTQEEIIVGFTSQVQHYMDSVAQSRNYDNILSLCTYATSTNEKFRREGQAGVEWRDAVWSKCYEILAEIQAGTRSVPEDIISELPVMNWGES